MNAIDMRPGIPRLNALTEILATVARAYAITPADLLGRSRSKAIAEARMLVCLLARRCTRLSSVEIGTLLGGRDHTTILTVTKSAERQQAKDPWAQFGGRA